MGPQIEEPDWKVFREVRVSALERFCERVLSEVTRLATETCQTSHQRYLTVFDLLKKQDGQLADTFNNPRRTTALFQLVLMRSQDLLTGEEFARFSTTTRAKVQMVLGSAD